jgi:DNA-binding NarL/FixJ family response regulator
MALRILIADDHEIMRKGVRMVLEARCDTQVLEAVNGQDAVSKTIEYKPDLVILDVSMPVMDGFTAAREIKKFSPDTPLIIFSLYKTEAFSEVAQKIGVSSYVTKVHDSGTLLKAVDAAINHQTFFPV